MATSGMDGISQGLHDDIGLDDFRQHVLMVGVVVCLVASQGVMYLFSRPGGTEEWTGIAILALYTVAVVTYFASRWSTEAGGWALASGLLVVGTGASWVAPLDWVVHFIPLAVLFIGAFSGFRGGLVAAIAVSLDALLLHNFSGTHADASLWTILLLAWANLAMAWLVSEPIRLALRWSWSHYVRAERETEKARWQQGEMSQLVKSLNIAQDRLEQVNLELERARRAADEARRAKASFAAFVSHELRLPLNIITGFSEMMVVSPISYDGQPLPTSYRSDVEAIYRAALYLSSLVDDVLDLSEIDAHQMGLQKEWVALPEVIHQASAAASGLFENKGLSLTVEVPSDLPSVHIDRTRIRQVILNLLKNAARFTDVGGVRLAATVRENDLVISIADTGIGIGSEDLPYVFEEFRQLEGAGKRRSGGSGLGLTISKKFVEMHGGSMWLESQLGEGTTFYFSLPPRSNVATIGLHDPWETWARPASPSGSGPRLPVAVLGKDQQAVRLLQRYLDGYDLVAVPSLEELLQVATDWTFQAIIVTQTHGQEDPQLVSTVLSKMPATPVIGCSVHTSRSIAHDLGVADYLVKPVDRERLAGALGTLGEVERVVVVDDDPEMARLLAAMVRSLSPRYQVWQACDGEEALALIEMYHPQAVFLDLFMPVMDGYEVLRQLRSSADLRRTPVIVVTAGGSVGEGITAEINAITRSDGLTVTEFCRCLQGALGSVLPHDTRQAEQGAFVA